MKIKFPLLGFLLSFSLLSSLIVAWPEAFLFYKSGPYPSWAKYLLGIVEWQSPLVFFALLPAVIVAIDFCRAAYFVLLLLLITPIASLLVYAIERLNQQKEVLNIVVNVVFHYFWIIGFHLLIPALCLLAGRFAWQYVFKSRAIFRPW